MNEMKNVMKCNGKWKKCTKKCNATCNEKCNKDVMKCYQR